MTLLTRLLVTCPVLSRTSVLDAVKYSFDSHTPKSLIRPGSIAPAPICDGTEVIHDWDLANNSCWTLARWRLSLD